MGASSEEMQADVFGAGNLIFHGGTKVRCLAGKGADRRATAEQKPGKRDFLDSVMKGAAVALSGRRT